MAGWLRALLFLLGGVIAAGGTAYFTGLLDPWFAPRPAEVSDTPQTAPVPEPSISEAASDEATVEAPKNSDVTVTAKQDRLVAPSFDLLRVEPDGSVLVAGKAGANALVELLSGETVIGSVEAGEEGDFVIVLDEQLPAGDYQLVLRTTVPGDEPVLSTSTAIVSVPQTADGNVLAMIEEPGAPAQLVTIPQAQPEKSASTQEQAGDDVVAGEVEQQTAAAVSETAKEEDGPVEVAPATIADADGAATAGETSEPAAPVAPQPAAATATVVVEAVEIEGDTIFIAGHAASGHTVRAYADAALLGEAAVSEGDRFLIEAKRDLAVGHYMIRADLIDKAGNVVARATVPFEREPGEAIAAVAPPSVAVPASPSAAPKEEPASQAEIAASEAGAASENAAPADDAEITPAAPLQRADGAVIIRRGDSLWRISRRVYGHGIRYSTIYLANQDQISDPDRIWPGQVFALPGETPEGEPADLEAIGDQSVEPPAP